MADNVVRETKTCSSPACRSVMEQYGYMVSDLVQIDRSGRMISGVAVRRAVDRAMIDGFVVGSILD